MSDPIWLGIVGAGPATQAIHIPTLARLGDRFAVAVVMDIDAAVAKSVAARAGARATTDFDDLIQDPAVEVVAICTPPSLHAEQVIAAMEAGKRAVFCEKPLATTLEEANRIVEVAERTGVPLVVGAMHAFDPGWLAVQTEVEELAQTAHTVRSSIVLPFNDRFEDLATEILSRPAPPAFGEMDAEARAGLLSMAVLGLAVHDLPLVRRFVPSPEKIDVTSAKLLSPFGYAISGQDSGRTIDIFGLINAQWDAHWTLEVISDDIVLHVDFTPSFVHAGSATATVIRADGTRAVHGPFGHNGYESEWRVIGEILDGDASHAPALQSLVDDLTFVVTIADRSFALFRKDARS
ncbi:Gfo/Idh/MocA family protein [Microbacterium saperdae]|uniref:Putative dehydrogenase n=1 Tax=Microbacterium saperdae TaxID=69368 RepID=A0A543BL66_9MICO|nr:Gfo/Idh/MocA family oxidoreductase [Microbacterium saperdae]TQL85554.1 putative dehydrogenase [Microbacterium saperdae]GGM62849.1 hypothetical protein GCM10010489_37890 [Microbacterium saperdae]